MQADSRTSRGRVCNSCFVCTARYRPWKVSNHLLTGNDVQPAHCVKQLISSCSVGAKQHGVGSISCRTLQAKQKASGSQLCQRCIYNDFLRLCNEWEWNLLNSLAPGQLPTPAVVCSCPLNRLAGWRSLTVAAVLAAAWARKPFLVYCNRNRRQYRQSALKMCSFSSSSAP